MKLTVPITLATGTDIAADVTTLNKGNDNNGLEASESAVSGTVCGGLTTQSTGAGNHARHVYVADFLGGGGVVLLDSVVMMGLTAGGATLNDVHDVVLLLTDVAGVAGAVVDLSALTLTVPAV